MASCHRMPLNGKILPENKTDTGENWKRWRYRIEKKQREKKEKKESRRERERWKMRERVLIILVELLDPTMPRAKHFS